MSTNKQGQGMSSKSANTTEQHKENYPLIEREELKHLKGIVLISTEEGHFLTYGKYRLGEPMATKEEAIKFGNLENWEFLHTLIFAISATTQEFINNQNITK